MLPTLTVNQTYMLRDNTWAVLFPQEWLWFSKTYDRRNAAKIKILEQQNDCYTIVMLEIASTEGKLLVPVNMTATVKADNLLRAVEATLVWKEPPVPDNRHLREKHSHDSPNLGSRHQPVLKVDIVERECWHCEKLASIPKDERYCSPDCRAAHHKLASQLDF